VAVSLRILSDSFAPQRSALQRYFRSEVDSPSIFCEATVTTVKHAFSGITVGHSSLIFISLQVLLGKELVQFVLHMLMHL
jgi:hypothetical protein